MAASRTPVKRSLTAAGKPVAEVFKAKDEWAAWLDLNHSKSTGVWVRMAKKGSAMESVSYAEALEVALCYGWIDGQRKPEGRQSWLLRFLPRSAKSLWSKMNREKVLALIADGKMTPAGLAAIQRAKEFGQWDAAYDSPRSAAVPAAFQAALDTSPQADTFFQQLDRTNRYAILWRIQTAKRPETRARRITQFIQMLERHEKIHN